MSESPHIHNVGMQNFQQLVLDNSTNKPILVDFWADWCQPCLTLTPILEKLVAEYDGKFEVAKINADAEQELAAHFGIKSLPTMKLFFQGQMVDERNGLVTEGDIKAMIDKHLVSESEQIIQAAMIAYEQGQLDQALELLNQALAQDPDNAQLKVQIAQLVYAQGDETSSVALLDSLDEEGQKLDATIKLRAEIKLAALVADLPDFAEIQQRLEQNPQELEALLFNSRHLTAQQHYEQAMDCLLLIMRLDRKFKEDAGQKDLLALFDMLGGEHPSVQKYRRKMFTLLH